MIRVRMPIELSPYRIRISLNQSVEPDTPLVEPSWGNVTDDVNHLAFVLWVLELLFYPLKHGPWVGGVSQQVPVLVIVCLSVHWDYFDIVDIWQLNAVESLCSKLIVCLLVKPLSPCICQSCIQHLLSSPFIIINIHWPALMVAHCRNDSCVGCLFQPLYNCISIIQVVILALGPNVVWGVVSRP